MRPRWRASGCCTCHVGALGEDGLDDPALAEDIALEARLALQLTDEIHEMSERIAVLFCELDPSGIVLSAPGVGAILAAQSLGLLGDPACFANLPGCARMPASCHARTPPESRCAEGGPTKARDACQREALYLAANAAARAIRPVPPANTG